VSLSMHRHWIIWTCDPEISNWKSAVVTVSRFYCCWSIDCGCGGFPWQCYEYCGRSRY
jgi:hypothetical protein